MLDTVNSTGTANTKQQPSLFSTTDVSARRRAEAWLDARLREAKATKTLVSEVVNVTPVMAEVFLARNPNNRALRRLRVVEFSKKIVDGRWKLTSQGISFSQDGILNNGQHRLNGIVEAGRTVPVYVTFGEDPNVFEVLDTGQMRGGSDTLHVAGYKNTTTLAAAARLLFNIETGTLHNSTQLANDELTAYLLANPKLEEVTTEGITVGKRFKCSTAATTAAVYRIRMQSKHADRLPEFLKKLSEGSGLVARSPILMLRDGIQSRQIDAAARSGNSKALVLCGSIIKTWNLWLRNRKGQIRFSLDEQFPVAE